MTTPELLTIYAIVPLAALAALGLYSEQRKRRFHPAPSEDRVFRCVDCGYVYTDDPDVDRSRCIQCGRLNDPIQF